MPGTREVLVCVRLSNILSVRSSCVSPGTRCGWGRGSPAACCGRSRWAGSAAWGGNVDISTTYLLSSVYIYYTVVVDSCHNNTCPVWPSMGPGQFYWAARADIATSRDRESREMPPTPELILNQFYILLHIERLQRFLAPAHLLNARRIMYCYGNIE